MNRGNDKTWDSSIQLKENSIGINEQSSCRSWLWLRRIPPSKTGAFERGAFIRWNENETGEREKWFPDRPAYVCWAQNYMGHLSPCQFHRTTLSFQSIVLGHLILFNNIRWNFRACFNISLSSSVLPAHTVQSPGRRYTCILGDFFLVVFISTYRLLMGRLKHHSFDSGLSPVNHSYFKLSMGLVNAHLTD